LKTGLDRYAALHVQTYSEAVDAATLIPHMLEAFVAGDRGFKRDDKPKAAAHRQPSSNARLMLRVPRLGRATALSWIDESALWVGSHG